VGWCASHDIDYSTHVPDRRETGEPSRSFLEDVRMTGPRRIALLMGQNAAFYRQMLLGIRAYADHAKQWLFHITPPIHTVLRPLAEWNPHGIIAHLADAKVARAILKLGKPVVDTACVLMGLDIPTVDVDHVAVGRLAADYLLGRGYRHFGFFGSGLAYYSQLREASFRETIEQAGFEVRACHIEYLPNLPDRTSWTNVYSQVREWLKELRKPVAVLADHDVAAHDLANMCLILGLRVPDDVAILGVDNDEVECQLAFPPLSSVAIPAERIGFEAARLLDRMISGKQVASGPLYLPSVRVVTRHSTSMFAIDDPIVTAALHYIRNHLAEPLKVSCIAAALTVRRRELEQKFRMLLGRSVLDDIHRVRVERAKELLASTDLPVSGVARQTGFSTRQQMAKVFHKVAGMAPGEYRHQTQVRPQP
jgi:LacI family transcriptional regulator